MTAAPWSAATLWLPSEEPLSASTAVTPVGRRPRSHGRAPASLRQGKHECDSGLLHGSTIAYAHRVTAAPPSLAPATPTVPPAHGSGPWPSGSSRCSRSVTGAGGSRTPGARTWSFSAVGPSWADSSRPTHFGWYFLGAAAALGVAVLPRIARRMAWPWLLVTGTGFASVWAWVLSTARGWDDFLRPLYRDDDYFAALPVTDIPGFLSEFTDNILTYATHVQGHPPGQVVLLALLDRVGLAHQWFVALLYVVVGSSSVTAAAVAMRSLAGSAGEQLGRRMLPAAILAPASVWIATSPDALFAGVLAWGTALLSIASARSRAGRPWFIPGLGAGLLLGLVPVPVIRSSADGPHRAWGALAYARLAGIRRCGPPRCPASRGVGRGRFRDHRWHRRHRGRVGSERCLGEALLVLLARQPRRTGHPRRPGHTGIPASCPPDRRDPLHCSSVWHSLQRSPAP